MASIACVPLSWRGRPAVALRNDVLEAIIVTGGGHLVSLRSLTPGAEDVNPLWEPPWPTVDPSLRRLAGIGEEGDLEGELLAGIGGMNLCCDVFGAHSPGEVKRGLAFHGEAGLVTWVVESWDKAANEGNGALTIGALLPATQLKIVRTYALNGPILAIRERVTNLCGFERAYGRAQHVTIGEQFLLRGPSGSAGAGTADAGSAGAGSAGAGSAGASSEGAGVACCSFRASVDRGMTWPADEDKDGALNSQWAVATEFAYPVVPRRDGANDDWCAFPRASAQGRNSDLCTLRVCPTVKDGLGWFVVDRAAAPGGSGSGLSLACAWPRKTFPWLMTWEENRARASKPWIGGSGKGTLCRGLEVSSYAFATSRRDNVARGSMFGEACFEWLDADETKDDTFFLSLQPTPQEPRTGAELCGFA